MSLVNRNLILSLIVLLALILGACTKSDPTDPPLSENTSTLVGTVEDITATTWTIDDKVVQVGDDVLIKGNILIGDQVEVLVTLGENATLQALEIEFVSHSTSEDGNESGHVDDDDQDPVEFTGTVESMDSDSWTINGKMVTITSQTVIKGNKHLGKTVLVQAYLQEDGSFTAIQIKPIESGDTGGMEGDTFEFEGIVEAMVGDSWTIGYRIVAITTKTEVDPEIALGDDVKVEGIVDDDGSLIALEMILVGAN